MAAVQDLTAALEDEHIDGRTLRRTRCTGRIDQHSGIFGACIRKWHRRAAARKHKGGLAAPAQRRQRGSPRLSLTHPLRLKISGRHLHMRRQLVVQFPVQHPPPEYRRHALPHGCSQTFE